MIEALNKVLIEKGYREMISLEENKGYRIYYDMMKSLVNAVLFVDASVYDDKFVASFKEQLSDKMLEMGYQTHVMLVVCVDSSSQNYYNDTLVARQVCSDTAFAWVFDDFEKTLIIYENQAEDFYGLKALIESAKYVTVEPEENTAEDKPAYDRKREIKAGFQSRPKATSLLVFINVLVFLICTFTGDVLYNIGTVGLKLINTPADTYRIITSMFLHADISHLFGNMVLLYFLGEVTEKEIKTGPFLGVYFASGICGCLADFLSEAMTGNYFYAIGASGAIFGLLGLLLSLAIFKRVTGRNYNVWRIIIVVIFSVYDGFLSPNVAVVAHIGGLVTGFILGIVICLFTKNVSKKGSRNED